MRVIRNGMAVVDPEQVTVYTDEEVFEAAMARHGEFIAGAAHGYGGKDELTQVAQVELWERDPSRYTSADDDFVRSRLLNAMRAARRRERKQRRIPLDGQGWRP